MGTFKIISCTHEELKQAEPVVMVLEHPVKESTAKEETIFPGDFLSISLKRSCFNECEYVALTGAEIGSDFKYTRKDW